MILNSSYDIRLDLCDIFGRRDYVQLVLFIHFLHVFLICTCLYEMWGTGESDVVGLHQLLYMKICL